LGLLTTSANRSQHFTSRAFYANLWSFARLTKHAFGKILVAGSAVPQFTFSSPGVDLPVTANRITDIAQHRVDKVSSASSQLGKILLTGTGFVPVI
jgi:hypothetical protein